MAHADTEHRPQVTVPRDDVGNHFVGWAGTCSCGWESDPHKTWEAGRDALLAHCGN